eukprot:gb/GECG01010984.1/.p1 GENE.gb/GECG01010984.1/~~gb/GECG01010984.1/.p1  ORF type:complete len:793 (+),score=92.79 gb/GECG01010984.1/:1-2379(+)
MADFFGAMEADMGGLDLFNEANPTSDILSEYQRQPEASKQDPAVKKRTLEDILRQEEVVQEVRGLNTELIDFLCEYKCLETIIGYIVEAVPIDEDDEDLEIRLFRFPYMCSEILCCGNKSIMNELFRDIGSPSSHIRHLLQFAQDEKPLRPHMAGYWTKVISKLCTIRPAEMALSMDKVGKGVLHGLASHFDNPCCSFAFQQIFSLPFHRRHAARRYLRLCKHDSDDSTVWQTLLQILESDLDVLNGRKIGIKLRGWEEFDVSQNNARNLDPKSFQPEDCAADSSSNRPQEQMKEQASDDNGEAQEDKHAQDGYDAGLEQTATAEKNELGPRGSRVENDGESVASTGTHTTVTVPDDVEDPELQQDSMFNLEDDKKKYQGYIGPRQLLEGLAADSCTDTVRFFFRKGLASIPAIAKKWNKTHKEQHTSRQFSAHDFCEALPSTKRDPSLYVKYMAKQDTFATRFVKEGLWKQSVCSGIVAGATYASGALLSTLKSLSIPKEEMTQNQLRALIKVGISEQLDHGSNLDSLKQVGAAPLDVMADVLDACVSLGGLKIGAHAPPADFLDQTPTIVELTGSQEVLQWFSYALEKVSRRGNREAPETRDYYSTPRLGARGVALVRVCCAICNCTPWSIVEENLLQTSMMSNLTDVLLNFPGNNLAHQYIVNAFSNIFYKGSSKVLRSIVNEAKLCDVIARYANSGETRKDAAYFANLGHISNLCSAIVSNKGRLPGDVLNALETSDSWRTLLNTLVMKEIVHRSMSMGGPAPEADKLTHEEQDDGPRTDAAEDALVG